MSTALSMRVSSLQSQGGSAPRHSMPRADTPLQQQSNRILHNYTRDALFVCSSSQKRCWCLWVWTVSHGLVQLSYG